MLNKTIKSMLTKYTTLPPSSKKEEASIQFVIKHSNSGDVQELMTTFEKGLKTENIQSVFKYPIMWSHISFDVSDYEPNMYKIEFDEMVLEAKLVKIDVSRKTKDGIDDFEYNFHFNKPISDDDGKMSYIYLRRKEENDEGKKSYVLYDVKIELAEEAVQEINELI